MNSQLHTPSGFSVYGGQIVIPTVADIDADGNLDYFVGDISGRLAYYAGQGNVDTGPQFELVSDYFENIQIVWTHQEGTALTAFLFMILIMILTWT